MIRNILFGLILLVFFAGGCASQTSADSGKPKAECLVCKMNFDLACIDVAVDAKTPTYMYNGQTYYFCSDECRDKFEKQPTKYLGK